MQINRKEKMNEYLGAMKYALEMAQKSPDTSTQNGVAVIPKTNSPLVIGAWNEFPVGVKVDDERMERPLKYSFIEHAERNAIFHAANVGITLQGATMVAVWAACADCARGIVQSGIERLVRFPVNIESTTEKWADSIMLGDIIMTEAGVEILEFDFKELTIPEILRDGKVWKPNG